MTKVFCDRCGKEAKNARDLKDSYLIEHKEGMSFDVSVSFSCNDKRTFRRADLCNTCREALLCIVSEKVKNDVD